MEPRILFGEAIKGKIALAHYKEQRSAELKEYNDRRIEIVTERVNKTMAPFEKLKKRNDTVILGVKELTADTDEVSLDGGTNIHQKIVVPIGKHLVTEMTPDHTVVCGVTYLRGMLGYVEEEDRAVFRFAAVPSDLVEHFIEDPHDLGNPDRSEVINIGDPEITPSALDIIRLGQIATGSRDLGSELKKIKNCTKDFKRDLVVVENDFSMVLGALGVNPESIVN